MTEIAKRTIILAYDEWLKSQPDGADEVIKNEWLKKQAKSMHTEEIQAKSRATRGCVESTEVARLTCKTPINNKSGIKGVSWKSREQKWRAQIGFKRKKYYLGCYHNIEDAAKARKQAEEMIFGPFLEWYEEYKKSLDSKNI